MRASSEPKAAFEESDQAEERASLVIVDDHPGSLEFLSHALAQPGLRIDTATDPEEGLELIQQRHPQIVLTDLVMPKIDGMQLLDRVLEYDPSIDVVLMTAHYSTESAVEAIRRGACDYLEKPVKLSVLRERVGKLLSDVRKRLRAAELEHEMLDNCQFEGIIGRSPLMAEVFARIRRIAPHVRTVLVTGETGTGKDLVASAIHRLCPASSYPFVVLNCSAVVESLFESELFGHMRGSFTGATSDKVGLFEHANRGTIFLDEIGDMPLGTQAKLLRAVQNQEVQRVGSLTARKVDVRVIAATHHDLRAAVASKAFREDLFYRLSMIEIRIPALRERMEDLPLLQRHFLSRFSQQFEKKVRGLTRRAQIVLSRHDWPGNVRELENVLGHACMMAVSDTIDVSDLPEYLVRRNGDRPLLQAVPAPAAAPAAESFADHEKMLVADALQRAGGNQSEAARLLQIGRDALRYKMKKHHLL